MNRTECLEIIMDEYPEISKDVAEYYMDKADSLLMFDQDFFRDMTEDQVNCELLGQALVIIAAKKAAWERRNFIH